MPEPGLVRSLALLSVSVFVFIAWLVAEIGDGPTALAVLVAAAAILTVAIQCALVALGS